MILGQTKSACTNTTLSNRRQNFITRSLFDKISAISKPASDEDIMNNQTTALKDGQAPARRIGALIAIVVICMGVACLTGIWYLFAREGLDSLVKSVSLVSGGETTTGSVT